MISFNGYSLGITKQAQKLIDDLVEPAHSKVVEKIDLLTTEKSRSLNIKKLTGYDCLY